MKKAKTVSEYIASAPSWAKSTLQELRRTIRAAAPDATESISYGMPYYSYQGRLAYFAVHTNHCGFYWISREDKNTFRKELAHATVVGSTLRIPRGERVPSALIARIAKDRMRKNAEKKRAA